MGIPGPFRRAEEMGVYASVSKSQTRVCMFTLIGAMFSQLLRKQIHPVGKMSYFDEIG